MAQVSDYGGNCHERGRGYSTKVAKDKCRSYRCCSCGKLTFYTHLQISRMKSQPRCGACGSTTEESEASFKRNTGVSKVKVPKLAGKIDLGEDACILDPHPFECRFCFLRFRAGVALKLHYEEKHDYYEEF